jgi:hypothetical protein
MTDALSALRTVGGEAPWWEAEAQALLRDPPPAGPVALPRPPPCAWLRPGGRFRGWQRVSHWLPGKGEKWEVEVALHACDWKTGTLCGTMCATSVPLAELPVITFFEGEIVDNANASFFTTDWSAGADVDMRHWARFPAFAALRRDVARHSGRAPGLAAAGAVFMRWKEKFFVSGGECRLTIAGFYYVALDRATGAIEAFYFDPASSPDQKMALQPCGGAAGHAFASHDLA